MKKAINILKLIFLLTALVLSFTSCFSLDDITNIFIDEEDLTFCFDYAKLSENVEKAEIVYVEDFSYGGTGKITVEAELDYETTLMLIEDFSKIQYITPIFGNPPEPDGYCIILWYKDGNYEIYGADGTTAKWTWCLDSREQFDELIEKYR